MTDFDQQKLQRLADRVQHAIGLVSYLQRTTVTTVEDLRAIEAALRTATAELHALRDAARTQPRVNGDAQ